MFQFACTLFFVFSHLFDSRSFFASPYSELRSSGCMMSETLTLMVATKACQASDLATPRGWTVGVLPLFAIKGHRRIHMEVYREQSGNKWCLKAGLSGKRQRLIGTEATALRAPGSKQ